MESFEASIETMISTHIERYGIIVKKIGVSEHTKISIASTVTQGVGDPPQLPLHLSQAETRQSSATVVRKSKVIYTIQHLRQLSTSVKRHNTEGFCEFA